MFGWARKRLSGGFRVPRFVIFQRLSLRVRVVQRVGRHPDRLNIIHYHTTIQDSNFFSGFTFTSTYSDLD